MIAPLVSFYSIRFISLVLAIMKCSTKYGYIIIKKKKLESSKAILRGQPRTLLVTTKGMYTNLKGNPTSLRVPETSTYTMWGWGWSVTASVTLLRRPGLQAIVWSEVLGADLAEIQATKFAITIGFPRTQNVSQLAGDVTVFWRLQTLGWAGLHKGFVLLALEQKKNSRQMALIVWAGSSGNL